MLSGPVSTIRRARELRRSMSLPEVLLWRELRRRPNGFKFRRQHAAGPYVLDFFCHEVSLAVEIDGEAHSRGDHPAHDANRDLVLNKLGIRTLRIPARHVLADVEAVVRQITAEATSPLHQPTAGPPPPWGEDMVRSC
ncbi:MAG TPA: endonuclease domain-containing protein [Allosphingosinicella sp.]|nr:endonuclease domain-containing protein [Allosphingosinicella sp.]